MEMEIECDLPVDHSCRYVGSFLINDIIMISTSFRTLPILLLIGGIVLGISGCRQSAENRSEERQGEGDENPEARAKWEWMRLRDPATGEIPPNVRARELAWAATMPRREDAVLAKKSDVPDYGWSRRGPFNIGGRTRALALDVTGEDTLLAGGVSGGMWRSSNGGASWTETTLPGQLHSVTSLAQDTRPGKTATWYFSTGEILGPSATGGGNSFYSGNGIYKSTNNGRSWDSLKITTSTPLFNNFFDVNHRVAIDPSNTTQDELYVARYGGIVRSTNGGVNWSPSIGDNNKVSVLTDVAVTSTGIVYATLDSSGGKRGIWRSTDGIAWTNITPQGWPSHYNRIVIGVAPSNENVVYFLAETPGSGHPGLNFQGDTNWASLWKYTYLSGDGAAAGGAWENRSANLPSFGGSFGDFNPQYSYDLHITVRPDNENAVYIGGTNLYRSDNGFATPVSFWIGGYRDVSLDSTVRLELEYPNHHPDQHIMIFSKKDPKVGFTGSDGGVHKTLDATAAQVSWIPLNNGYYTSQFYTLAIDHATPGDNMIIGGLQDNGTWMTNGAGETVHWDSVGSGDGAYCAVADGKSSVYVAKQEGKAYRVLLDHDGKLGTNTRIDPLGGKNYLFISPYALDPSNTDVMYFAAGYELWRNTDLKGIPLGSTSRATVNWSSIKSAHLNDSFEISALGVSKASPSHRLFFGTVNGRVYRIDNADGGEPATVNVTGSTFPKNAYVSCIAVDPEDGNKAVVVFSNYSVQSLFYTADAGVTWTEVGGNLETGTAVGPSCRWFSFLHRPNGTIFLVGTSTGLYSANELKGRYTYWLQEGISTIGTVVVDMIDTRQSDGLVAVATHGGGVFSSTIGTAGVEGDEMKNDIGAIMLYQNVPNPVEGRTTIRYSIEGSGTNVTAAVKLAVYDMTGNEVVRLVDRNESGGDHEVLFDTRDGEKKRIPAGTYLLRLQAGDAVRSRTFEIIR